MLKEVTEEEKAEFEAKKALKVKFQKEQEGSRRRKKKAEGGAGPQTLFRLNPMGDGENKD